MVEVEADLEAEVVDVKMLGVVDHGQSLPGCEAAAGPSEI